MRPKWSRDPVALWNRVLDRCVIDEHGCWLWQHALNENGYAVMVVRGRAWYVHRWVYTQYHRPLVSGETVDHECHHRSRCTKSRTACQHRRCLNPEHMAAATAEANSAKQERSWRTRCPQGHEYTEENTYRRRNGNRMCRRCSQERALEWQRANRSWQRARREVVT